MDDAQKKIDLSRDVLVNLRKITQAIDLHSKQLVRHYGLTGPQLVLLETIRARSGISVTALARATSLSQATVTSILNRLEKKGFIFRKRSETDKRRMMVELTKAGECLLEKAPPPLQETFVDQFGSLENWEQSMILSSLQRLVVMMEARKIDASPILATGPIVETVDTGDLAP